MEHSKAIDLWKLLNHRFGLHFRKEGGRDNQLYDKLKENLAVPQNQGITNFLQSTPEISALRFIQAFLNVTEPFSNMYKDIFTIMKEYSMKESNETVKIQCKLDEETLDFDLDHFKEFIRVESLVTQTIQQIEWQPAYIYEIPHFFRVLTSETITVDQSLEITEVLNPPPVFSNPKLNEYLFEIYSLLLNIKNKQIGDSNWYEPYSFAKPYYDAFVSHGSPLNIEKALETYEKVFFQMKRRQVKVENLIQKFEEYLNLPFWKNRWYVYEVWITLQTVKVLKDYNIKLNVGNNGVLPLSSGRHTLVGSFLDEKNIEYTLHAQLQTSVEGFEQRKGMEPDLRIIEGHNLDSEFTKIIIECKQRIAMNQELLEKNIKLYEHGAVNSLNIFVNYDKFPEIQEAKFTRTHTLSNLQPNNIEAFFELLKNLLITSNINPYKYKPKCAALLLDASGSMARYLTPEVKGELLTFLEDLEIEKYFYFNLDLIESFYDNPQDFLKNVLPTGGTNLNYSLKRLINEYPNTKTVVVITDEKPIFVNPAVSGYINEIEEIIFKDISNFKVLQKSELNIMQFNTKEVL